MSKSVSTIVFSFFLLFQTAAVAEETPQTETNIEAQEPEADEITEDGEPEAQPEAGQEASETRQPEASLSEAEKEALAAEEAELRESGFYEEAVEE